MRAALAESLRQLVVSVPGASDAVQVQYDPDVTGARSLISAVDDAGFEATLAVARCYI